MVRDERATPLFAYILGHVDHRGLLAPIYLRAIESLGALRVHLANKLGLIDSSKKEFKLVWVISSSFRFNESASTANPWLWDVISTRPAGIESAPNFVVLVQSSFNVIASAITAPEVILISGPLKWNRLAPRLS